MKKKIILYVIIILVAISLITVGFIMFNNKENNTDNDTTNNTDNSPKTTTETSSPAPNNDSTKKLDDIKKQLNEQEKSLFNSNFDMYMGKNVKGVKVKSLIATILSSNSKDSNRKVSLIINGEESTNSSKISSGNTYSVSFEYDDNGFIYQAIVKDN